MKTRVNKLWTASIMVLAMLLVACLTGMGFAFTAHAAEGDPTSTVRLTSYTTVMRENEEFEFAAEVTLTDGSISNEVTWTSSNEDAVVMADNLAIAIAEGSSTITATAADGAFASVSVLVSNSAIRVESVTISPESLELGVGWHARVYASVLPTDAYDQGVHFSSSDTSILTVTDDGYVTAVAEGQANVIAMSNDGSKTDECPVTVIADLVEAQLSDANNTFIIGESKDLTVVLPEGLDLTDATYQWTTSDDEVASFDTNNDATGTLSTWSFGTVELNVIVTLADGTKYGASGSAYVTASYFYLVGIRNDWTTYETAEEAQEAGMLLVEDADRPGIFSITRNFWAYDSFQIIHGDIDAGWTTKITPYWYYAAGSDTEYVANTADMFEVNALGDYTITLDLTSGRARVSIDMVDLYVTEVDLTLAEGQNGYLQNEGDTTLLDIKTLPENAIEPAESDIVVTVSSNAEGYATAALSETNNKQVIVTLLQPSETMITFTVEVKIDDAVGVYPITILPADQEFTAVTEIAFEQETYLINVNNGGEPWTVGIKANVNEDASVQGVYYMSDDDSLVIEYDAEGNASARASKLGTFTIEAYALGDTKYVATAQVVVYSQDGFYLIGILGGEQVNNWTSLAPDITSLEGTLFQPWALTATDNTYYSGRFTLNAGDQFSIAFLGMSHEWIGVVNNAYFDAQASDPTITLDGINVQINVRAIYTVTLDLSKDNPVFTVTYYGEAEHVPVTTYRYLYLTWSGSSWDGSKSDKGNIIAEIGVLEFIDGVLQEVKYTSEAIDFYSLVAGKTLWPTIQFVLSDDMGTEGEYFINAEWYGTDAAPVLFGGDAYSENPGTDGTFTNSGCELYWVGAFDETTNMTVTFTFTFSESGALTAIDVNFVTPAVDPAE